MHPSRVNTRSRLAFSLALALVLPVAAHAQEQADPKTLLPQKVLDRIADEVSGSTAMRHIVELGAYEGKRYEDEYAANYFETEYILKKAKEYGLSDIKVERYTANPQWHARKGELWIQTADGERLLISHRDEPTSLVPGSASANLTAEIVYVGFGTSDADYAGKDLKGRIALTDGPIAAMVAEAAVKRGAVGVISTHNALGKPMDRPTLISWTSVGQTLGSDPIFAFALSDRLGRPLIEQVRKGVVKARVDVETTIFRGVDHETTVATIPGDGSTDEEVVFVAHLFEGVTKQGAGDNVSGSATVLETARAYRKLINDGVLPQPRRTIRFLWAPEFAGTIPWMEANASLAPRILAGFNMDMVGANLTFHKGNLKLHRTPFSLPTFVSDVAQQFVEYVGETNREKVHNRRIAYAFSRPIFDPRGSQDPFYYHVEKYYGSSDHAVFAQAGVPFAFFNHWPDAVYHTNLDRPDGLDPTQLKRTAFLAVAIASVLGSAGSDDVARLAAVSTGYAAQRVGNELRDAALLLASSPSSDLTEAYKEARAIVKTGYEREVAAIASTGNVAKGNAAAQQTAQKFAESFSRSERDALTRLDETYMRIAGVNSAPRIRLTPEEEIASKMFPTMVRTGIMRPTRTRSNAIVGFKAMEALWFADGNRSALDIRNAVSAELGPVPVADVIKFFEESATEGIVTIRKR